MRSTIKALALALALIPASGACGRKLPAQSADRLLLADRYERGDRVPRDYRRAAELLAEACAEGNGSRDACRRLALARQRARGIPRADTERQLHRLCDDGDWLSCVHVDDIDVERAQAACNRDDATACYAYYDAPTRESDEGRFRQRAALDRACRAGVFDACKAIIENGESEPADVATPHMQAACWAGDADACAILGKPLPATLLCAAHDYEACLHLAVEGDVRAREAACEARLADACWLIAIEARDRDVQPPNLPELMKRACDAGATDACGRSADDLASGCLSYDVDVFNAARRRGPLPVTGTTLDGAPWRARGPMVTIPDRWLEAAALDAMASRTTVTVVSVAVDGAGRRDLDAKRAIPVVLDATAANEQVTVRGPSPRRPTMHTDAILFDRDLIPVAAIAFVDGPALPALSPITLARCVDHTLGSVSTHGAP